MDYRTATLDELLAAVASERVTPAGGSAAAVVGAVGTALCEMCCVHTAGHDGTDAPGLAGVRDDLRRQREHLLDLAAADEAVVDDLFAAGGDPEQSAVKRATGVPLTVAVACRTVLDLSARVAADGVRSALPDVETGATFVHAALRASLSTVRHNLDRASDEAFVDDVAGRVADVESGGERAYERVVRRVDERS